MIAALLLLQAATAGPPAPELLARYDRCLDRAVDDPAGAAAEASAWRLSGGGFLARQCLGMAYANQQQYDAAAGAFEDAGAEAELAKDARAANYWAQAGNAWLAAGEAAKARAAIDKALLAGTLKELALGEAHLDRARALVAQGQAGEARADMDLALAHAKDDPLAWLLSATLARRNGDLPRARRDIAEALSRASDDASVQLEAGNIAAASGDEAGARKGWQAAAGLAPGTPQATAATKALAALDAPGSASSR